MSDNIKTMYRKDLFSVFEDVWFDMCFSVDYLFAQWLVIAICLR